MMGDQGGGKEGLWGKSGNNYFKYVWTGILQFAQWKSFNLEERKSAS